MADKTKAELEAELNEVTERNSELESINVEYKNQLATRIDTTWYEREMERLGKKADSAEGELKALKEKNHLQEIEREVIANDAKTKRDREMSKFGTPDQNEHTRFRLLEKAPIGQRDIFGDPTTPVFDLGRNLTGYTGGVYIPVSVVIEAGISIGMLTAEQASKLKEEFELTKSKVESAGTLASELSNGIAELVDRFYYGLNNNVVGGDHRDSGAESASKDAGENAGQADGSESNDESNGVPGNSSDSDDGNGTRSLFESLQ